MAGSMRGSALEDSDAAVIVAVAVMGMVQMPSHEIVDVIAMRNPLMPAPGAVLMRAPMLAAIVLRRTASRMLAVDLDHMLVDVIAVGVVQMTVVQIVDVIMMLDRGVTAVGPMFVGVTSVGEMFRIVHATTLIPDQPFT